MKIKEAVKTDRLSKLSKILARENRLLNKDLELNESILDPIHSSLNKQIFTDNKMNSTVRKSIISTFIDWFEKMGHSKNEIKKMVMIGSSTGYQYDDNSDIDINIEVDLSQEEIDDLWDMLPNGNNLKGTKHPINYYLAINDKGINDADSAYDLFADKWIKETDKGNIKIPYYYVLQIAKFFMEGIELRFAEYNRDKYELELYKTELANEDLEIDKKELEEIISQKENEILADLDSLYVAFHMVHSFRQEAFEDDYEPPFLIDIKSTKPNLSVNNIVYKILERFGYIDRLLEIKKIRKQYVKS